MVTSDRFTINMAKLVSNQAVVWAVGWTPKICSVNCSAAVAAFSVVEVVSLVVGCGNDADESKVGEVPDLDVERISSTGSASPLRTFTRVRSRSSPCRNRSSAKHVRDEAARKARFRPVHRVVVRVSR